MLVTFSTLLVALVPVNWTSAPAMLATDPRFTSSGAPLKMFKIDGLAAVRDRPGVEAEAGSHLRPRTYLEPFALRSLGVVREDEALIARALAGFEKLRLGWHAEKTRALL